MTLLTMPLARLLYYYLAVRAVIWSVVLYTTQPSQPLDVLEHLAWAQKWQLVYEHHPGAVAWIVGALDILGGGDSFLLSLPAPIAVSLTMAAVWQMARRVMDDKRALVAVLSLEGIWYFTIIAAEFNHNILQLAAWAFVVVAAHRAFLPDKNTATTATTVTWIVLGIAAALSLYAKYSSLLLLCSLLLWSISDNNVRQCYKQRGVYIALAVFALLTLPQVIALSALEFSPLGFALSRTQGEDSAIWHLLYPAKFVVAQLGALVLAVILCCIALQKDSTANITTNRTDRRFVLVMAFVPLLLAVCICALGGWRFRSHWGASMLSFVPMAIMLITSGYKLQLRRFVKSAMAVALLSVIITATINTAGPFINERGKRIHYPGAQIGAAIEKMWSAQNPDKPLTAVIGSQHLASLVSFYAPSRPHAIINGNWNLSYGISQKQFNQTGGAIVWMINDGKRKDIPIPDYAKAYQNNAATLTLQWQTPAKIPPLIIGVTIIPPARP